MPAISPDSATGDTVTAISFVVEGPVSEFSREEARRMVDGLAARAPRPLLRARLKLRVEPSRSPDQQAVVQGTLDVSGTPVRAEAAGPTVTEAIGLLEGRLERRLRRLAERREDSRERPPTSPAGGWRHGDLPDVRPAYFPRPREERAIVRRKTFAPREVSVEEALFDLVALDYRFFLFTQAGHDAVVYERGGEAVLQRAVGGGPAEVPSVVTVNPIPAPTLTADEAVERLNLSSEPFVFYRDRLTDRGRVVYRRYDGHYGLVEPR